MEKQAQEVEAVGSSQDQAWKDTVPVPRNTDATAHFPYINGLHCVLAFEHHGWQLPLF